MNPTLQLHLASSSPRRAEILRALGLEFHIANVAVNEQRLADEKPAAMVLRLAAAKATAIPAGDHLVLGADTAVVVDERVLGKPQDRDDAIEMLLGLSGREHVVLTGVALQAAGTLQTAIAETTVEFREITRDEAIRYWQSGEPRDKAGGYAVQGLAGAFVKRIEGSYSGVVGLPVFETVALLGAAGINVLANKR